jgi:hypothetical protein
MPLHYHLRSSLRRLLLVGALVLAPLAMANVAEAAAAPSVSSVRPAQGSVAGGEQVTIYGSGFLGTGGGCSGSYEISFGTDLEHGYAILAPSYRVISDNQMTVTVPPSFGGTVDVRVHDSCGTSPVASGDRFTYVYPAGQCTSGTCSVSISSTPTGTLGHVAVGFLDGFNTDAGATITPQDVQLVDALHPRQWRLGQDGLNEPGGGVFGLARKAGAQITLDLTSDWEDWAYSNDRPSWQTPYGDLSTYYSFIYNDVKNRIAANEVPDYFDVWNEPADSGTVNQWLSVYGTAYRAIKAADPNAQVEGPSIGWFLLTSAHNANSPGYDLSLSDFLNWELQSGDRFAAISWHEDGTTVDQAAGSGQAVPGGYRDYWSPAAIADHVAAARALLAQYPQLSGTKLFVNEYGPTYAANVPGWMVGDFAALEDSGAAAGMLTCVDGAACSNLLDGLLGADGQPQMPYWVMSAYSRMSGELVSSSASGSNIYTLATRNDASETMQALIGRGDDCWGGQQCPQFHDASAPAAQLSVSVRLPWSASRVTVTVQPLRNSATSPIGFNDVASPPATSTTTPLVQNGEVTIPVGAAYDGDAFYVTITPVGSAQGSGSSSGTSASPANGTNSSHVTGSASGSGTGGVTTRSGSGITLGGGATSGSSSKPGRPLSLSAASRHRRLAGTRRRRLMSRRGRCLRRRGRKRRRFSCSRRRTRRRRSQPHRGA